MQERGKVNHPAKYTSSFIPIFAKELIGMHTVLDPFAGTGKLAEIKNHGFSGVVICNEIEHEWASRSGHDVDEWHIGDAANMEWCVSGSIDAICTSPTYGNRLADHYNAKDLSKRITYKNSLGRELSKDNTGRMQWGEKYKQKHSIVYSEFFRVLKEGGISIINLSNHIRKGAEVDVVGWHKSELLNSGLSFIKEIKVETPRMRLGANGDKRVKYEYILVYKKITNARKK